MTDKKMVEISLSKDDANVLRNLVKDFGLRVADDVVSQIREQVKPAMEEPMARGSRVMTDDGEAYRFANFDGQNTYPWMIDNDDCYGGYDIAKWSDLKNPRPVETEVPDGYIMIKRPGIDYDYTPGSVATEYLNEDVTSIHGTDLLQRGTITDLCRAYLDAKNEEFNK